MMKQIQEALTGFEEAVVRRENKKLLETKIPLQQGVDKARDRVVQVVVELVRANERT